MRRFQVSNATGFLRYFEFYQALKSKLVKTEQPRVLVFGCSTGQELQTVYHFWPAADVYGCDIDEDVLEEAKSRNPDATIFKSDKQILQSIGKFDLVCANSVLCRHPLPKGDIRVEMPFSLFDEMASKLCSLVSEEGFLFVYNASYFFQDVSCFLEFIPVRIAESWTGAFVPRLSKDGIIVANPVMQEKKITKYILSSSSKGMSKDRLSVAIFKKTNSPQGWGKGVLHIEDLPEQIQITSPSSFAFPVSENQTVISYEPFFNIEEAIIKAKKVNFVSVFTSDIDYPNRWSLHGRYLENTQ